MAKIQQIFEFETEPLKIGNKIIGSFVVSGTCSCDKSSPFGEQIEINYTNVEFKNNGLYEHVSIKMLQVLNYGELPEQITAPAYAHCYKLFFGDDDDTDVTTDLSQGLPELHPVFVQIFDGHFPISA